MSPHPAPLPPLSEVRANLEVLEDQGRVRPLEGDVVRYAVA